MTQSREVMVLQGQALHLHFTPLEPRLMFTFCHRVSVAKRTVSLVLWPSSFQTTWDQKGALKVASLKPHWLQLCCWPPRVGGTGQSPFPGCFWVGVSAETPGRALNLRWNAGRSTASSTLFLQHWAG